MKTTLMKIQLKKEKIHWKRTRQILSKFNGILNKLTFGLIVVIIGSFFHYCFAIMSILYESFLFVVANKYFKSNLQKMSLTVKNI